MAHLRIFIATKEYAVEKLKKIEAFDGFKGELNAEVVSKVYEGLGGIENSTYLYNIVALELNECSNLKIVYKT